MLTPALVDQLCTILRAGCYLQVAIRAVGLPRSTFRDWLRRGRSGLPSDAPFRRFRERVEEARATAEVASVAAIARAAPDNWQAAAWMLERQYPERWGRVPVNLRERTDPSDPPVVVSPDAGDPFAELDELAARRRRREA